MQFPRCFETLINEIQPSSREHKLVGHEAVCRRTLAHQDGGLLPSRTTTSVAASFGLTSPASGSRYSPGPVGVVPYWLDMRRRHAIGTARHATHFVRSGLVLMPEEYLMPQR